MNTWFDKFTDERDFLDFYDSLVEKAGILENKLKARGVSFPARPEPKRCVVTSRVDKYNTADDLQVHIAKLQILDRLAGVATPPKPISPPTTAASSTEATQDSGTPSAARSPSSMPENATSDKPAQKLTATQELLNAVGARDLTHLQQIRDQQRYEARKRRLGIK